MSVFAIIFLIFGVSQLYWLWVGYRWASRRIRSRVLLWALCAVVVAAYWTLYEANLGGGRELHEGVHLTWKDAFLSAPYRWWAASSLVAFFLALLLAIPRGIYAGVRRAFGRRKRAREVASPARRGFLHQTATAITAAPFVAGAYGLLYGRLNLEVTEKTIRLPRLPRAFEGFRICQLSDIHIGPFMPAEEIRKYVAIANAQKAEMIALTGDFVTFDPDTQQAVVEALSGLRAPFGKYGCLGNHDMWAGVEDSITGLFRQTDVRMLRGINVPIESGGDHFNLLGVDFQSPHRFGPTPATMDLLGNIENLIERDGTNILLSHNPDTFDRAASLGIDLSLAGHTHGGQASLEFISPELAPSRLVTPYVAGWFQKPGGQLYVNRGIGTIFIPIRIGAPPEITIYKLTRA
jgi:predicted MPP superfamily phosphohydrolase